MLAALVLVLQTSSIDLGGGVSLELVRVQGGSYTRGSPETEEGREAADEIQRAGTTVGTFDIGKYEVTRGQFARFVADTKYRTEAEKGASGGYGWNGTELVQKKEFTWKSPGFPQTDRHPVVIVTFGDARAFAEWATRKAGRTVRLPSEDEWEYAARAGESEAPKDLTLVAWVKDNAGNGTREVGTRQPNAWGLFDMGGNAFEWTTDKDGERHWLRGGSWLKDKRRARPAARFKSSPGSRNADYGFRIVVDLDQIAPAPTYSDPTRDQPQPLPSPSPPAVAPRESSSGVLLLGVMVVSILSVGGVGLAFLLLSRRRKELETRIGNDGFYIIAPGVPAGTRVRYECLVKGLPVSDVVPLEGGRETFVYTGSRPLDVKIVEVMPGPGSTYRSPQRRPPPARVVHVHHDPSPQPEPFVGYPRAY
jgi:formylglycine-generating enzyme required for sulfatase activity